MLQSGLTELVAGHRTGDSRPGEKYVVRRLGLPDFIANFTQSATDPGGSAGGVNKTPWSFLWESSTICAPGAGEAAMASSSTAQGITGQRAGAAVGEK